ncbi:MAG TPA: formylglycine-generating enzyme family protein [Steroidobacteraceae bacterium]|nr:formylglycine-generating enzyme family protein [Steroidobacteraceae bacterium]
MRPLGVPKARRTEVRARWLLAGALLLGPGAAPAADNAFLPVAGAELRTVLPAGREQSVRVAGFLLQRHPVTNAEFLAFVSAHPEWRRGTAPRILVGSDYLGHWSGALAPGTGAADAQPVTRVSWFAAQAYCEAQGGRLPGWYEWELAAAAGPDRRDARSDPLWRQQLLDWYARPAGEALPAVGEAQPNFYGLYDLHGLVWEWVLDFNSLLPADADPEQFCGSGAQNLQLKDNYAVLMRIAMLGSLRAADTGRTLGFRCARDGQARSP